MTARHRTLTAAEFFAAPQPFTVGKYGDIDVNVEYLNGRPRVRLGNRKGGWFCIDITEIADVAAALDRAVTMIVERERAVWK